MAKKKTYNNDFIEATLTEKPVEDPLFREVVRRYNVKNECLTKRDARKKVSPIGIAMWVNMLDGSVLQIDATEGIFLYSEEESTEKEDVYFVEFELGSRCYRVKIFLDNEVNTEETLEGLLKDVWLSVWWEREYFYDGDKEDDLYQYSAEGSGIKWVYNQFKTEEDEFAEVNCF